MANVFVQCGLRGRLEYDYLTFENWHHHAYRSLHSGNKFSITPELFEVNEHYHVVGVCMDPVIEDIRGKYADNPLIHLFHNVIWHEDVDEFAHEYYTAMPEYGSINTNAGGEPSVCPAITLNTLFQKIRSIPGLEASKIRVLHMNIEKSELNALKGIDWDTFTPPDVMRISTHSPEIRHFVISTLLERGYNLEPCFYDGQEYLTFKKLPN